MTLSGESYIGLDLGSTSSKCGVFDREGQLLALFSKPSGMLSPRQGYAEMDPETVLADVEVLLRQAAQWCKNQGQRPSAIGCSSQMHGLLAMDREGKALTPLMTWADTRAVEEALSLEKLPHIGMLNQLTGCRIQHPMYPVAKLMWLFKHHPDLCGKVWRFVDIKSFILYHLFGEVVTDQTMASASGLYDLATGTWAEAVLALIPGLRKEQLPEIVPCTYALNQWKVKIFESAVNEGNGKPTQVPFIIGTGDGMAAHLGCGVNDMTRLSSTVGTSGALRMTVKVKESVRETKVVGEGYLGDVIAVDVGQLRDTHASGDDNAGPMHTSTDGLWCYALEPGTFVKGGAINNGGISLQWLERTFKDQWLADCGNQSFFEAINDMAASVPPGSDGLIYLPYLTGERSPDWSANVRGMMFGLDIRHTRKHLVRANLEGVMYRMKSIFDQMGIDEPVVLRANGGYSYSPVWLQIQADIFNCPVEVIGTEETSLLGAVILAMKGCGDWEDRELLSQRVTRRYEPIPEHVRIYEQSYRKAMAYYEAVKRISE